MHTIWLMVVLLLGPAQEGDPITLTAAADLAGWVAHGSARAETPPMRSAQLDVLFDGNPDTLTACGENGEAVFTFYFNQPITLNQVGIFLGGGGVCRWRLETLSQPADEDQAGFTPLIPWRYTEMNRRDLVPLALTMPVWGIRYVMERKTLDGEILVRELECYTPLELVGIELEEPQRQYRVNNPFHLFPVAMDRFGGRLPLEEGIQWSSRPKGMLERRQSEAFIPRHEGVVSLRASFLSLTSKEYLLTVQPPEEAPRLVQVTPFKTSAAVLLEPGAAGARAHALYLRRDGEAEPDQAHCLTRQSTATLFGLSPKTVYHLSAAGVDQHGVAITRRSEEVRIRTGSGTDPHLCRVAQISLLVPIYKEGYTSEERAAIRRGCDLARIFFYRATEARLHFRIDCLDLPGRPPMGDGSSMEAIEADLRQRGALITNPRAIHVVGRDLTSNFSGYIFQSGAVGSCGSTATASYPGHEVRMAKDVCWTLVHELQHSLEWIIDQSDSNQRLLSGHFLENLPLADGAAFDVGDYYDGQQAVLSRFQGYRSLPSFWIRLLETADADGDDLPDHDERLPMDEARLGSISSLADSDGDGLSDLGEFCAGLYGNADPLKKDTDQDGLLDGTDTYPLCRFFPVIPRATPRKGELPPGCLSEGIFFNPFTTELELSIHAAWDPQTLYLAFLSDQPIECRIQIDGSGHLGPFESDRRVTPLEARQIWGSDVYCDEAALHASFGIPQLTCANRILAKATVLSIERKNAALLWLAIPAAIGPGTKNCRLRNNALPASGLTLEPGRVLGFSFQVRPVDPGRKPNPTHQRDWCSVYETHRFFDATLLPN